MALFPDDEVRPYLKKILAGPPFGPGKKTSDFLSFVVEKALKDQSDDLKQYTIATEALSYQTNFDPSTNPSVRIMARRVRRALDQYYSTEGRNDKIRISVPNGRYIPDFSKNQVAENEPAPPVVECPPLDLEKEALGNSIPSIAVISIQCLNGIENYAYLASGLTEEILIGLTRFKSYPVIGPLNRKILLEQGQDILRIGSRYDVQFVIEGTLRFENETLLLTIRMSDALTGMQLWGNVVECQTQKKAVWEFRNTVVAQVVSTIADHFGVISNLMKKDSLIKAYDDLTVYDAHLRYYHHFRVLTEESQVAAIASLEKAIKDDPEDALALAMLGDLIISTYLLGFEHSLAVVDQGEEMARKAVALDPECQTAVFVLGLVNFINRKKDLFQADFQKAVVLNPNNANYLAAISLHTAMAGFWKSGMEMISKAFLLNPHHPGWYHLVPFMEYYRKGEYQLAFREAKQFNTPDYFWDPILRAASLGQLGRKQEAAKAVDNLLHLVPNFPAQGRDLIQRYAYSDENTDMLVEGLNNAGMDI